MTSLHLNEVQYSRSSKCFAHVVKNGSLTMYDDKYLQIGFLKNWDYLFGSRIQLFFFLIKLSQTVM